MSHTIAIAIVEGLFTSNKPFFRTPKMKNPNRLLRAMVDARWEWFFALALWASAVGVYIMQPEGGVDLQLWMLLLVIQSLPYFAAIVMAIISGLPDLPAYHDKDDVTPRLDTTAAN